MAREFQVALGGVLTEAGGTGRETLESVVMGWLTPGPA